MDIVGIKIEERNKKRTVLSLQRDEVADPDIKMSKGHVTWYREGSVHGMEEAQEIADRAIELSTFWKKFKGKDPEKVQFEKK